jgi:YfiH family protein
MPKTSFAAPTFLTPDWPAPAHIRSLQTTRLGGYSQPPYDSMNLGDHVGDAPAVVAQNRTAVSLVTGNPPCWLQQVHGTAVFDLDHDALPTDGSTPVADAAISREAGKVCVIMTADCLPLLFCDRAGTVVAAAHAGWRGLCDGVIESTVAAMQVPAREILVWLGPAIGSTAFEVGEEVRAAFIAQSLEAASAFHPSPAANGKWFADIFALARQRLHALGVDAIYGGGVCTVSDPARFFSHRRSAPCGRLATLIWKTA